MKVIITGATGFIGKTLCKKLIERGDNVTVFTRNSNTAKKELPLVNNFVEWNYKKPEMWERYLNETDAIVHLAGANLFGKRWSKKYKQVIMESREISTRNIVGTIKKSINKPKVFICSSGINVYGDGGDNSLNENCDTGSDFLSEVCKRWEAEAEKVEDSGVRRVSLRTGVVLDQNDGALKKMLLPFKVFLGGPLGRGTQWFSWIHINDLIKIILVALDNNSINGPVNAVSPNPVTMNELAKTMGKILHRPSFFKVPEFVLKIAVGEGAVSILASLKVKPDKLQRNDFKFQFEKIRPALEYLLK